MPPFLKKHKNMSELHSERFELNNERHNQETQRFIERKEFQQLTLAEQFSKKDLDHFYSVLTPKLQAFREFMSSLQKISPEQQTIQRETMRNSLKIALNTTLYEIRNVPKAMLVQHFKDTITDVFAPQERVLEFEQSMLRSFNNSPDEKRAEEFLWKCTYYIEQLQQLKKNLISSITQSPPSSTSALQEAYLHIADAMWEQRAAFGDPKDWLQEFIGNIAKNEQDAADSLLEQLDVA